MSLTEAQKQQIAEKKRLALLKQQSGKSSVANNSSSSAANKTDFFGKKIDISQPQVKFVTKRPYEQGIKTTVLSDQSGGPPQAKKTSFYSLQSFQSNGSSYNGGVNFSNRSNYNGNILNKFASSVAQVGQSTPPSKFGNKFGNNKAEYGFALDVNFVVISESQFEIRSKFDHELLQLCKSMPRREYDAETRQWRFPIEDYNLLFEKIKSGSITERLNFRPLPAMVLKLADRNRTFKQTLSEKEMYWDKFPNSEDLMDFQREGIKWVIGRNGRALIGDEMGLGKTVQALMVAYHYKHEWPLLIVCPSSLRSTWADSIARWLPSVQLERIAVVYSNKDVYLQSRPEVVVVSYNLLQKLKGELSKYRFKVAILDESHFIKSGKAARTKAVQEVVKTSQRLLLLSGTPMMSKPIEMFTQLQMLDKATFSNQTVYAARYCDAKQRSWGMDYNGSSNLDEFKVLLSFTGFLRRLKKDVLSQLPPKTRKIVTLDKSLIKNKEKSFSALSKQLSNVELSKLLSGDNKQILFEFFNQSARAKLPAVINYVDELFESGVEKLLLFGHHVEMLDGISDHLNVINTDFIRIDGKTLSHYRQALVDKFQNDPDCKVALLSITAANTGLTLTAASVVVFAELYWNPGDLVQAEDRAYRIGQHCNLTVHYLIANKTADDQIWPLIKNKLAIMKQAGLSNDNEDFKNADRRKQVVVPRDQSTIEFDSTSTSSRNFSHDVKVGDKNKNGQNSNASIVSASKITDFLSVAGNSRSLNNETVQEFTDNKIVHLDSGESLGLGNEFLDMQNNGNEDFWDDGGIDDSMFEGDHLLQTQKPKNANQVSNNFACVRNDSATLADIESRVKSLGEKGSGNGLNDETNGIDSNDQIPDDGLEIPDLRVDDIDTPDDDFNFEIPDVVNELATSGAELIPDDFFKDDEDNDFDYHAPSPVIAKRSY